MAVSQKSKCKSRHFLIAAGIKGDRSEMIQWRWKYAIKTEKEDDSVKSEPKNKQGEGRELGICIQWKKRQNNGGKSADVATTLTYSCCDWKELLSTKKPSFAVRWVCANVNMPTLLLDQSCARGMKKNQKSEKDSLQKSCGYLHHLLI